MKSIGSHLLTEIVFYVDSLQGSLLTLLQTQQKDLPNKKPPPLCICDNKMSKDLPQVQVIVRLDTDMVHNLATSRATSFSASCYFDPPTLHVSRFFLYGTRVVGPLTWVVCTRRAQAILTTQLPTREYHSPRIMGTGPFLRHSEWPM